MSGVSAEGLIPNSDITLVAPYMEMYNYVMTCKNLGISVDSENFTTDDLDLLSFIQNKTEEAHEAKRKRKSK